MTPPEEFDVTGPLPTGTCVLEASAGTGKTWVIAALAARYVAEGVARLDQLLLVTFGREATRELQDRVRGRLTSAARALADPAAAAVSADPVERHLATGTPAAVAERRGRLLAAVGAFDGATVATTHEFCSTVLRGLGTSGDVDPDAVLVESLVGVTDEVVDDFYLRKYARAGSPAPLMTLAEARTVGHAAVGAVTSRLAPPPDGLPEVAATRVRFASAVRKEVDRRKRLHGVLGFDDLLTQVAATLTDPKVGPGACARLRERYRVVLVDEFQDTDPVQWTILQHAFAGSPTTMILVGDPKQAIYGFRGGDVVAYLDARRSASDHRTLSENHRSDDALLTGLGHVFRGAALGDPEIVVRPVVGRNPERRLTGAGAAVRLRVVTRTPWGSRPVTADRPSTRSDRSWRATLPRTSSGCCPTGPG